MIKNFYFRIILIIGLTTVCCSFFGQTLLFLINISKNYYKYLILLTPLVLLFTKYSNKIIKTHGVGMKYFVEAANKEKEKVSWFFPIVLTINTLLAHVFGVSVGREGVAVQLGGAIGKNMTTNDLSDRQKKYFVRLGMISGFAALFQTPLAAVFFILEIIGKKIRVTASSIYEFTSYIVAAFISARLSHLLGLEKFFIEVNVSNNDINLVNIIKIAFISIILTFIGILFVIIQKKFKIAVATYKYLTWVLLVLFIVMSFTLNFRYASLGTNLIDFSFNDYSNIKVYDFILKLIFTAICTAIGFSGGEVTPLFAIGASCGVVLGVWLGLPVLMVAGLGYCLVFSSATKTWVTPIFLALEAFGFKLMLIMILPAVLLYFINKKYSIYS